MLQKLCCYLGIHAHSANDQAHAPLAIGDRRTCSVCGVTEELRASVSGWTAADWEVVEPLDLVS